MGEEAEEGGDDLYMQSWQVTFSPSPEPRRLQWVNLRPLRRRINSAEIIPPFSLFHRLSHLEKGNVCEYNSVSLALCRSMLLRLHSLRHLFQRYCAADIDVTFGLSLTGCGAATNRSHSLPQPFAVSHRSALSQVPGTSPRGDQDLPLSLPDDMHYPYFESSFQPCHALHRVMT